MALQVPPLSPFDVAGTGFALVGAVVFDSMGVTAHRRGPVTGRGAPPRSDATAGDRDTDHAGNLGCRSRLAFPALPVPN